MHTSTPLRFSASRRLRAAVLFALSSLGCLASATGVEAAQNDSMARASEFSKDTMILRNGGRSGDRFGASVDHQGNTAVIGAWGVNGGDGHAYVSSKNGNVWSAPSELVGATTSGSNFGWSTVIDANTVAVGARLASQTSGETLEQVGSVTFFERNGSAWSRSTQLFSTAPETGAAFGYSVDLRDGTAIIGEPGANDLPRNLAATGAAYIAKKQGGQWRVVQRLLAPNRQGGDAFGTRVALSRDGARTLAFVASLGSDRSGVGSGTVYVFERTSDSGSFRYIAEIFRGAPGSQPRAGDQFGTGLAADQGQLAVIGAPGYDTRADANLGAVEVYAPFQGNGWSATAPRRMLARNRVKGAHHATLVSVKGSEFVTVSSPTQPGTSPELVFYRRNANTSVSTLSTLSLDSRSVVPSAVSFLSPTDTLVGVDRAPNLQGVFSGGVVVVGGAAVTEPSPSPVDPEEPTPAPVGGALSLAGLGLGLMAMRRRRRKAD